MRRLLLVLLATVVVVTACTGGDSDGEKAAQRRAQRAVDARVLATTDLPSVYSSMKVPARQQKSRCDYSARIETADRIAAAEVAFQNADTQAQLQEIVSRYEPGRATELIAEARKLPTDCATYSEKQGADTITLRTEKLDLPSFLDESFAVKVTGSVGSATVSFHEVFMRLSDTFVVLVHGGLGDVDSKLTETLAGIAAKKVMGTPTASTITTASA